MQSNTEYMRKLIYILLWWKNGIPQSIWLALYWLKHSKKHSKTLKLITLPITISSNLITFAFFHLRLDQKYITNCSLHHLLLTHQTQIMKSFPFDGLDLRYSGAGAWRGGPHSYPPRSIITPFLAFILLSYIDNNKHFSRLGSPQSSPIPT